MTAQKVIIVPTERSIPPVMITKVTAIASTPFTDVACKIAIMFEVCMKFGEAMEKPISSTIRLAKARTRWWVPAATRRDSADFGVLAVVLLILSPPRQAARCRAVLPVP